MFSFLTLKASFVQHVVGKFRNGRLLEAHINFISFAEVIVKAD